MGFREYLRGWTFAQLLGVLFLLLLQGTIFYAAFENAESKSALGYVSFAGTITSIVLAVIAIFFSFLQVFESGKDVEVSRGALEEIRRQVSRLDRLDSIASLVENTRDSVARVEERIDAGFNQTIESDDPERASDPRLKASSASGETEASADSSVRLFRSYTAGFLMCCLAYVAAKGKALRLDGVLREVLFPVLPETHAKYSEYFQDTAHVTEGVLVSLGYLKISRLGRQGRTSKIVVDELFAEATLAEARDPGVIRDPEVRQAFDRLLEQIDSANR